MSCRVGSGAQTPVPCRSSAGQRLRRRCALSSLSVCSLRVVFPPADCIPACPLVLSVSGIGAQSPVSPFPRMRSVSCPVQVHKLLIVVELLLGEIPDRLQFRQPSLKRSLMPYFLLTQGKAGLPEPCLWPDVCVHLRQLNHPCPHSC